MPEGFRMLDQAFNSLLSIHNRSMKLFRKGAAAPLGTVGIDVQATPSNYFRNLEGPSEMVIHGREFILSKENLLQAGFTLPLKRGDYLVDPELGAITLSEIREIYNQGGAIMGFRVRSS